MQTFYYIRKVKLTELDNRNVDYTNHELILKTPEGKQIAGFELAFSEGEELFRTETTVKGANITYTRSTETVNIEVKLMPDQSGAVISQATDSDKLQASESVAGAGSLLWWIAGGVMAVILSVMVIVILLKKKK